MLALDRSLLLFLYGTILAVGAVQMLVTVEAVNSHPGALSLMALHLQATPTKRNQPSLLAAPWEENWALLQAYRA